MATATTAGKEKSPRAARSVTLTYKMEQSKVKAFYNETIIQETTYGSYFMACGWNNGYFGIQHVFPPRDKVVLFSVWDPVREDDPDIVPVDDQVKATNLGVGVTASRFGGEGCGTKLMADFQWEVGQKVCFYVEAKVEGKFTSYTGWVKKDEWWRLGTLTVRTGGKYMRRLYSFVEDFRRDRKSVKESRKCCIGNGWVKDMQDTWRTLPLAQFHASNAEWESKDNIDCGPCENGFYLITGGDITRSRELYSLVTSNMCHCQPCLPSSE